MTPEELANEIVKHCYHKTLHGKYSCVICTKKAIRVAIRAAQAEQRRKDADMARGMTGARPREIADAILAQEE